MHDIYEKTARQIKERCGLAGAAIATVSGDTVDTWLYGYADAESKRPVTEKSFFDIASNTKAFTTMLAAMAQEENVFDWDTPIIKYIPEFRMKDPAVTQMINGRDMASHRTGISRHDFLRSRVTGDRRDTALRVEYMQATNPFRDKYEYMNNFYILLGYALERIYGRTWEALVTEKIASPLGMEVRYRGPDCDLSGLDCALPYAITAERDIVRCDYTNHGQSAPCGGIRTNIEGMTAWMKLLLGGGTHGGVTLCGEDAFRNLIAPVITCPGEGESPKERGKRYALGWQVSVYGGYELVHHGGTVPGFNSRVGFFPELGKGFIALFNTNGTAGPQVFQQLLCDSLLDRVEQDYGEAIEPWNRHFEKKKESAAEYAASPLAKDMSFCGKFYHPAFDDYSITEEGEGLVFSYGSFSGVLRQLPDGRIVASEKGVFPQWVQLRPIQGGLAMRTADNPRIEYEFVRLDS